MTLALSELQISGKEPQPRTSSFSSHVSVTVFEDVGDYEWFPMLAFLTSHSGYNQRTNTMSVFPSLWLQNHVSQHLAIPKYSILLTGKE